MDADHSMMWSGVWGRTARLGWRISFTAVGGAVRDSEGLLDQRFNNLRLRHRLDHLPLDEDLALAVTGRHPEISLSRLTRSIDDASHDGDPKRSVESFQTRSDLVCQAVHIDLGASARRAGDNLEFAWPQVQRLQDVRAHLDFLN